MLSEWLKLMRIHTACLTQAGLILGCILAGAGNIWNILFLIVLGTLFHIWGFIENNLCDADYDKKDPHKKHFPLVSGSINDIRAAQFGAMCGSIAFFASLIYTHGAAIPGLLLLGSFFFGMVYNHISKTSTISPLFISLSFSLLPVYSYSMFSNSFSPLIVMVFGYSFIIMMYQISVEGYMKDIKTDPVSLMRDLGVSINGNKINVSLYACIYGLYIRVCAVIILFIFVAMGLTTVVGTIFLVVIAIVHFSLHDSLMSDGEFNHVKVNRLCAIIEILAYISLITALYNVLGMYLYAFMLIYPIVWFIVLNKATWGTYIMPDV